MVVPFVSDDEGGRVPPEALAAAHADEAKRRAQRRSETHASAAAFSRTGDVTTGEFGETRIVAIYGAVGC